MAVVCVTRGPPVMQSYEMQLDGHRFEVSIGDFVQVEVSPGDHLLRFSASGHEPAREDVMLRPGEARAFRIVVASERRDLVLEAEEYPIDEARQLITDERFNRSPDLGGSRSGP